jgi:hypothetical protein
MTRTAVGSELWVDSPRCSRCGKYAPLFHVEVAGGKIRFEAQRIGPQGSRVGFHVTRDPEGPQVGDRYIPDATSQWTSGEPGSMTYDSESGTWSKDEPSGR